jgi:hypothetical protein
VDAARNAAQPAKHTFVIGFLTGHEMNWPSQAMHLLRDELEAPTAVAQRDDSSPSIPVLTYWISCRGIFCCIGPGGPDMCKDASLR